MVLGRGVRSRARDAAARVYHSPLVPSRMRDLRRGRAATRELLASIAMPPTTFTEKVRYRMATDRRRILVTFADKLAVREYVREKVGAQVLTRLHAVAERPEALLDSDLPREFVLKPSHASGATVIVGDHVPPERRLPERSSGWDRLAVAPGSLDWDRLVDLCRGWLARRYNPYEEPAYSKVRPRILIEELLRGEGVVPLDYKYFVFGGTVRLVQVDRDRFDAHKRNLYSPEWEPLDVEYNYPRGPIDARPDKLDEMIALAERLADRIDFVRVDLYNIGDRVVFGEMTSYPVSGWGWFDPPKFDAYLGGLWPDEPRPRGLTLRRTEKARHG